MKTVIIYKEVLLNISETFIAEQARALQAFRPKYVGLARPEPCLAFDGVPLYLSSGPFRFSRRRLQLYRRIPLAPLFHRSVQRLRADLLHAHFATDGLYVTPLSERLRLPLIVTLHGCDVTIRQNFAPRYARLWNRASLFLCVSEFIRAKAIEAGFPAEKLRVHRIGIDVGRFQPPRAPRVPNLVLFVGRLVEKKGCEVLLNAMQAVGKVLPEASLVVIGDGPQRAGLVAMAARLGLACRFLGPQPPVEIQAWMQKATVFCVPSQTAANGDSEGLGMVFLEAQACGLPVVSTLHGGIPEAVSDGETGTLVPEGDGAALAQALIGYLERPELARKHGSAGRDRVAQDFDLFRQTRILEAIYEQVALRK